MIANAWTNSSLAMFLHHILRPYTSELHRMHRHSQTRWAFEPKCLLALASALHDPARCLSFWRLRFEAFFRWF